MKKVIKIIFIITFFIILCYITIIKLQNPLETIFPINFFIIQSGSMKPQIDIGEVVVVLKTKQYKQNDIITYLANNSYFITHRIVEITDEGYITKGDSNNTKDEKNIKIEEIKGKVIFHSKLLGIIFRYKFMILAVLTLLYILKIKTNRWTLKPHEH